MTSLWSPWQVDPSPFADHGEMGSREGIARDVEPSRLGGGGIPTNCNLVGPVLLGGCEVRNEAVRKDGDVCQFPVLSFAAHKAERTRKDEACRTQRMGIWNR